MDLPNDVERFNIVAGVVVVEGTARLDFVEAKFGAVFVLPFSNASPSSRPVSNPVGNPLHVPMLPICVGRCQHASMYERRLRR